MALLLNYPKGGSAVELTVTPAPVSDIAIKGRFRSSDVDMSILSMRDLWKRLQ